MCVCEGRECKQWRNDAFSIVAGAEVCVVRVNGGGVVRQSILERARRIGGSNRPRKW